DEDGLAAAVALTTDVEAETRFAQGAAIQLTQGRAGFVDGLDHARLALTGSLVDRIVVEGLGRSQEVGSGWWHARGIERPDAAVANLGQHELIAGALLGPSSSRRILRLARGMSMDVVLVTREWLDLLRRW